MDPNVFSDFFCIYIHTLVALCALIRSLMCGLGVSRFFINPFPGSTAFVILIYTILIVKHVNQKRLHKRCCTRRLFLASRTTLNDLALLKTPGLDCGRYFHYISVSPPHITNMIGLHIFLYLALSFSRLCDAAATDPATGALLSELRYPCQFILCVHNLEEIEAYRNGGIGLKNNAALNALSHCTGKHTTYVKYEPQPTSHDQCQTGSQGMTFFASGCDAECHSFTTDNWDQKQSSSEGMSLIAPFSEGILGRAIIMR